MQGEVEAVTFGFFADPQAHDRIQDLEDDEADHRVIDHHDGDAHRHDADEQRVARPDYEHAEHVPPELVRAQRVPVLIRLDGADVPLRPGMSANVTVYTR